MNADGQRVIGVLVTLTQAASMQSVLRGTWSHGQDSDMPPSSLISV